MSNDPAPGGEQPGRQGQPYPGGGYGQQPGEQPAYPGSYPPPNQPGYGQNPPPWAPQNPDQPQRGSAWPGAYPTSGGAHGPAGVGPGGLPPQNEPQGFAGALFDFGFNTFATPVVIKVLYILSLVGIVLFYLIGVVSGFLQGALSGLVALIGGGVLALVALIYIRVLLEMLFAVVRIAEDVRVLRNRP